MGRLLEDPEIKNLYNDFVDIVQGQEDKGMADDGSPKKWKKKEKKNITAKRTEPSPHVSQLMPIGEEKELGNSSLNESKMPLNPTANKGRGDSNVMMESQPPEIDHGQATLAPSGSRKLNFGYWKSKIESIYATRATQEKSGAGKSDRSINTGSAKNIGKVFPSPRKVKIGDNIALQRDSGLSDGSNPSQKSDFPVLGPTKSADNGPNYESLPNKEQVTDLGGRGRRRSSMQIDSMAYNFGNENRMDPLALSVIRDKIRGEVHTMYGRATPEQLEKQASDANSKNNFYFWYTYGYATVVFFSVFWFGIVQGSSGTPIENDKISGFHLEYFFTVWFGADLVLFFMFRTGPN